MHLIDDTGPDNVTGEKMATSGLDIRLKRQPPVLSRPPTMSTKPPRLRLTTKTLGSLQQNKKTVVKPQTALSSDSGNLDKTAPSRPQNSNDAAQKDIQEAGLKTKGKIDRSRQFGGQIKRMRSLSVDSCLNHTGTSNQEGNRPLRIHHQRHNLKNRFLLEKTLGEGTYGKVKLASDKTTGEQVLCL